MRRIWVVLEIWCLEEPCWEMGWGWGCCLGKSGGNGAGHWTRWLTVPVKRKSTEAGCGDRHPPEDKQAFDQMTCSRQWGAHGLKQLCESQGLCLWWMTHSGAHIHMNYPTAAVPCKFSHERPGGATLLSRYQFIASVSSSSHDWFIANPFSVQCINHTAACQGSPFMLLRRLQ